LIVVLIIIVLMTTLVTVSMAPVLAAARTHAACRIVVAKLNYARSFAVANNTQVVVTLQPTGVSMGAHTQDSEGLDVVVPVSTQAGRYTSLPEGVQIVGVTKDSTSEEQRFVAFTQYGQAENAVITLRDRNGKAFAIVVEAFTGRCRIVSLQTTASGQTIVGSQESRP
jgi:Tfp pilus assembly protein FimT